MPKCKFCGEEINIEIEEYVKHSKRYQHVECLRRHLMSRKRARMDEEEAERYVEEIRREFEGEKRENEARIKLFNLIMYRCNINILPKRFYLKVSKIINGTYEKFRGETSYIELLSIYTKMENFLTKQCYKNNIKKEESYDYEFHIVIMSINKYRLWREKQEVADNENVEIIEVVKKKANVAKFKEQKDIF